MRFYFSLLFVFAITFLNAQTTIVVAGSTMADGTYTQSVDFASCPCYENAMGVVLRPVDFWLYKSGVTCATYTTLSDEVLSAVGTPDCDLANGNFGGGITVMIQTQTTPEQTIPTLSQWGLIILGTLLASFGIVAIINRKVAVVK